MKRYNSTSLAKHRKTMRYKVKYCITLGINHFSNLKVLWATPDSSAGLWHSLSPMGGITQAALVISASSLTGKLQQDEQQVHNICHNGNYVRARACKLVYCMVMLQCKMFFKGQRSWSLDIARLSLKWTTILRWCINFKLFLLELK